MKSYADYNDNEIIYLVKNGNDEAYSFMVEKYSKLIYSRIKSMSLYEQEDCFQEGLITLYNAILNYNDSYNKTFNKYFEHLLHNKLIDIKRKQEFDYEIKLSEKIINNSHTICETIDLLIVDKKIIEINKVISKFKDVEKKVYDLYFMEHLSIEEISKELNLDKNRIYYLIFDIKRKIKKNMVK